MSSQTTEAMHPAIARFLYLAINHPPGGGITEYLLWDTLEGKREKPFPFYDPLSAQDMAFLTQLRDELGVWPYFREDETKPATEAGQWLLAPIDAWRAHTLVYDFRQMVYEREYQNNLRANGKLAKEKK